MRIEILGLQILATKATSFQSSIINLQLSLFARIANPRDVGDELSIIHYQLSIIFIARIANPRDEERQDNDKSCLSGNNFFAALPQVTLR